MSLALLGDERRVAAAGICLRLVKGLFERGLAAEEIRQLFRLIDWFMELPQVALVALPVLTRTTGAASAVPGIILTRH